MLEYTPVQHRAPGTQIFAQLGAVLASQISGRWEEFREHVNPHILDVRPNLEPWSYEAVMTPACLPTFSNRIDLGPYPYLFLTYLAVIISVCHAWHEKILSVRVNPVWSGTLYSRGISGSIFFISAVALLSKRLQKNPAMNEVRLWRGIDKHYWLIFLSLFLLYCIGCPPQSLSTEKQRLFTFWSWANFQCVWS